MPEIETHADIVKGDVRINSTSFSGVDSSFGISPQHRHSQRLGKGTQVFDGRHRRVELLFIVALSSISDVLHQNRNGRTSATSSARLISSIDSIRRRLSDRPRLLSATHRVPIRVAVHGRVQEFTRDIV